MAPPSGNSSVVIKLAIKDLTESVGPASLYEYTQMMVLHCVPNSRSLGISASTYVTVSCRHTVAMADTRADSRFRVDIRVLQNVAAEPTSMIPGTMRKRSLSVCNVHAAIHWQQLSNEHLDSSKYCRSLSIVTGSAYSTSAWARMNLHILGLLTERQYVHV